MTSFLQEMSQHDFLLSFYNVSMVPEMQRQWQQGTFIDTCMCLYIFTLKLHHTKVTSF